MVAFLVAASVPVTRAAEAQATAGTFRNLGPQITASTLIGTTFAKDPDGRELVYSVMRGHPAKLVVFDLRSGDVRKVLPLAGADGAWNAATASDGSVYVGTDSNGHLYRWVPGEEAVRDLGQVPGQSWVWDVEAGRDGEVFVSTYPGARVFRYHPKDGFKDLTRGEPASPGEQYARSLAWDPATGKIYVGVGSHAHLVELDPATGTRTEMLPGEYAGQEFVYGVNVFGGHLFAFVTNKNVSLVINLRTRKVEYVLPAMQGQQVMTRSPVDGKVYYTVHDRLYSYDPAKPTEGPVNLAACAPALGMTWVREAGAGGPVLAVFTARPSLVTYDPATKKTVTKAFTVPREPVVIQSIHAGPDGRVWMGGYLSGGNATYDPVTDKSVEYKGLSQAESIGTLGMSLYFGLYPGGKFARYDTSRVWNMGRGNPRRLGQIEGQSRPFAALGVPELNRVFFGTVPEYGRLGGGIAEVDPADGKLTFHPDVVKDHSVIALAYSHGLLVGGTSVWGGLGIEPAEKSAKLFLWDPKANQNVFETVPVDGMPAVSALIPGPDGNVWGMAGGTLFVFDPAGRRVVSRHELFAFKNEGGPVWRDATLVVHPWGQIYGTEGGHFFRLDPKTKQVTVLREKDARLLAMDRQGRLYFRDRLNLWQYTP